MSNMQKAALSGAAGLALMIASIYLQTQGQQAVGFAVGLPAVILLSIAAARWVFRDVL